MAKLSRDFFNSMFTTPTLNPNHRGGAGTPKRRGSIDRHTPGSRIHRKLLERSAATAKVKVN